MSDAKKTKKVEMGDLGLTPEDLKTFIAGARFLHGAGEEDESKEGKAEKSKPISGALSSVRTKKEPKAE